MKRDGKKRVLTEQDVNMISQNYRCRGGSIYNNGLEKAHRLKESLSMSELTVIQDTFMYNVSDSYSGGLNNILYNIENRKQYSDYILMTMLLIEILHYHDMLPEVHIDLYDIINLTYSYGETGAYIVRNIDTLLSPTIAKAINKNSRNRSFGSVRSTASLLDINTYTMLAAHNSVFFVDRHNMEYVTSKLTPSSEWLFMRPLKGDFTYIFGEAVNISISAKQVTTLLLASIYNKDLMVDKYDFVVALYEMIFDKEDPPQYIDASKILRARVIKNIEKLDRLYGMQNGHISYLLGLIKLGGKEVFIPTSSI